MEPQDKELAEVTQEDVDALTAEPTPPKKLGSPLAYIRQAVKDGTITPAQARQFRRDMGISQGFFTDKQTDPHKRKQKNKQAKKARKLNAKNRKRK